MIVVIALLFFGMLAWLAKSVVQEHIHLSALGVFIVCFLANSSILLPSSSLLIVVEYSLVISPVLVAVCGAAGASLGEMTGFCVGRCGRDVIPGRFVDWLDTRMRTHTYLMVFLFSMLPLPLFDVVGLLSGAMKLSPIKFFLICFAGKLMKMLCYVCMAQMLVTLIR